MFVEREKVALATFSVKPKHDRSIGMSNINKLWITRQLRELKIFDVSTVLDDGTIDVRDDVDFGNTPHITAIPITFGHVRGGFTCWGTKITSLKGSPHTVDHTFMCNETQITTLDGAPRTVGWDFMCHDTPITSLVGMPQTVGGNVWCDNTLITTLDGAPQAVGGSFMCENTQITSLDGAPRAINGEFWCRDTPKLTAMLPILRIKGITKIYHETRQVLMRHYKPDGTGDVIACQDDLIESGFAKYARMK